MSSFCVYRTEIGNQEAQVHGLVCSCKSGINKSGSAAKLMNNSSICYFNWFHCYLFWFCVHKSQIDIQSL